MVNLVLLCRNKKHACIFWHKNEADGGQSHNIHTTVTSWARWRLQSSAYRLFAQPFVHAQIKENIKAPRHWPLWGESTGDRRILLIKGPVTRKMFSFDDVIMNGAIMTAGCMTRHSHGLSWNRKSGPWDDMVTCVYNAPHFLLIASLLPNVIKAIWMFYHPIARIRDLICWGHNILTVLLSPALITHILNCMHPVNPHCICQHCSHCFSMLVEPTLPWGLGACSRDSNIHTWNNCAEDISISEIPTIQMNEGQSLEDVALTTTKLGCMSCKYRFSRNDIFRVIA